MDHANDGMRRIAQITVWEKAWKLQLAKKSKSSPKTLS